ncbi:preprotein translocase subunit SecE [Flavobacterium phycosphaerae]|uniref:preprotein translocase subunit SecE n=1 Tax=Flavobacterium phycosphaerae TaxID=2697515 RepID=UPI00138A006F|nr:preprotein translocase subunit SecE [Flavobacterium phycosphaerae]
MAKIVTYISEAFEELKTNVTWPEWAEVQKFTVVVALFSVIFALATWGVDELCAKAIAGIFNLIKS